MRVLNVCKATGLDVNGVAELPISDFHYWSTVSRVSDIVKGHYMRGPQDGPGHRRK